MFTIYILIGLVVSLVIVFDIICPIMQQAKEDGVMNPIIKHPTIGLSVNLIAITFIWPVFAPIFLSSSLKEAVILGFTKGIYIDI